MTDPFYGLAEQQRRCLLNWHNYNEFQDASRDVLICKVCGHLSLPHEETVEYISSDVEPHEDKIVGHPTRDGTINFDRTW